ncbi:MAG: hypothetical protein HYZ34_15590 [Ignavibacteriae bacterium]|nr:hypothetical protein [Ignavibacteriota bacterium]
MLTNIQIEEMIERGAININPFDPKKLGSNHYRLTCHSVEIFRFDNSGVLEHITHVLKSDQPFAIAPHEYVIISIKEKIILQSGIFGEFYPASRCIEKGLILNYGRLNSFYNDSIHFGLFNARNLEFVLRPEEEIARVSFTYVGENTPIRYDKREDLYHTEIDNYRKK